MDGALFSLLFFFFVQISAGVAPMRWPKCAWLAGYIFWVSSAGAVSCLLWYGYSNQEWFFTTVAIMGQKTAGVIILIFGVAIGAAGLTLIARPEPKHDPRPVGLPSYTGTIAPEPEIIFSAVKKQLTRTMEIGSSGAVFIADGGDNPLFTFGENSELLITREEDNLKVSTQFRDKQGSLIAELERNEWKVAPPPKTWDRNYNKHALEVKDDKGNIVLQVRLLTDRVQIQGEWWVEGFGAVRFVQFPVKGSAIATSDSGGKFPPWVTPIQPMFKYPSDSHFGELRQ